MSTIEQPAPVLRWAGLLLLVGVVIFGVAMIAADPFEQETARSLYEAIATNGTQYYAVNLLAAAGIGTLLGGFVVLARRIQAANRPLISVGLVLLSAATILWITEVVVRLTSTVSIARAVVGGSPPPATFPGTIGVGLEALLLAFLVTALAGLAALVWGLGDARLVSARLARVGVMLIVTSGTIAAVTYPWVGGVERALFYPLILVLLPLAIMLLLRSRRRSNTLSS